jgi:hypothetical protein
MPFDDEELEVGKKTSSSAVATTNDDLEVDSGYQGAMAATDGLERIQSTGKDKAGVAVPTVVTTEVTNV